jgi:hypothetical protein
VEHKYVINSKSLIVISMILVLFTSLGVTGSAVSSTEETTEAHASDTEKSGEKYLPGDSLANIASAMDRARQNNTLVLVIMGANWCHDSRALASRVGTLPLSEFVSDNYETVFVDVGYLDKGKDVITSLGIPVYYATPTVLIIDPVSGQLVNADNRHQWGSAASISMDDSLAYFQQIASTDLDSLRSKIEPSQELQHLLTDIDAFEQLQADRLYLAYEVLAPMLDAYKNGDKDQFSEDTWAEIRQFRSKVPLDVDALRKQARQRVAAGETNIKLDYPSYPAFSWATK